MIFADSRLGNVLELSSIYTLMHRITQRHNYSF